jgi:hypothetical protein
VDTFGWSLLGDGRGANVPRGGSSDRSWVRATPAEAAFGRFRLVGCKAANAMPWTQVHRRQKGWSNNPNGSGYLGMPMSRGCRSFGTAAWIKADELSSGRSDCQGSLNGWATFGRLQNLATVRRAPRGATYRSVEMIAGFAQGLDRLAARSRRQMGLTRGCVWIGWTELL